MPEGTGWLLPGDLRGEGRHFEVLQCLSQGSRLSSGAGPGHFTPYVLTLAASKFLGMGSLSKGRTILDKYIHSLDVVPLTHQYTALFSEVHSDPARILFLGSPNSDPCNSSFTTKTI